MITLHFSPWWLLLALAIVLLLILANTDGGNGIGGGLTFCLVLLACVAIFLIALAFLVGYQFAA